MRQRVSRDVQIRQDTAFVQNAPDMVGPHHGRFQPQDKSEITARNLNQV